MKNFILLLILLSYSFSDAKIKVDKTKIYRGEKVTFKIIGKGKSIKFPQINYIENYKVVSTTICEDINIINGKIYFMASKDYVFYPQKNVTIPSFEVIIDGKKFHTKPVKIEVKP